MRSLSFWMGVKRRAISALWRCSARGSDTVVVLAVSVEPLQRMFNLDSRTRGNDEELIGLGSPKVESSSRLDPQRKRYELFLSHQAAGFGCPAAVHQRRCLFTGRERLRTTGDRTRTEL